MNDSHAVSLLYVLLRYLLSQAHQQMDPTDIVKVPYDLEGLFLYVMGIVVVLWLFRFTWTTTTWRGLPGSYNQNIWIKLPVMSVLTLAVNGVILLCGKSPVQNPWHTFALHRGINDVRSTHLWPCAL
jgi:hypothetical protein